MIKHFNTAWPSTADLHYLLDPLGRIDLPNILSLIEQRRYFVLHAPRQTGKTTCLLALRDALNHDGQYVAVYANIEGAQALRQDMQAAMQTIASVLGEKLESALQLPGLRTALMAEAQGAGAGDSLRSLLRIATLKSSKPIVLFLDEVDALVGDTLISLLRQIRAGYTDRPEAFPQTIVLCGVRDVRDYRMTLADGEVITGGSAFNIKAESLRLGDFSEADIAELYQQHTDATGQAFSHDALALAWQLTRGQPWLVNALAEQAVWKTAANLERTQTIDEPRLRAAGEALILRNDTHLDQLTDKLREPRVRAVIEPMLLGLQVDQAIADLQYVYDLGLIRLDAYQNPVPANAIYAEVLPRVLNSSAQFGLHSERIRPDWQNPNGSLNPHQLLRNFLEFWKKDGEPMMATISYHDAAPHLVVMAYLQRVVNGRGRIEREYAAGSGRLDLLVVFGAQHMAIEVKVWRHKRSDPLHDGLEQIERYLTRLSLDEGFLVLFDQRSAAPDWPLRMSVSQARTASGLGVTVLRG